MPRGRALLVALWALTAAFLAARLVHLLADFPPHIETWSGVIYTDEGWYANAAISQHLLGHWYLPGDLNRAVNLPFQQAVMAGLFRLFGMSLTVARLAIVGYMVLMALALGYVAAKLADARTAAIAALLVASNFVLFAYSRLAILEVPMMSLAMLACACAVALRPSAKLADALVAGLVLACACLTKTSAVAMLPAMCFLLAIKRPTWSSRVAAMLACAAVVGAVLGSHAWLATRFFRADWDYFMSLNLGQRVSKDPVFVLRDLIPTVRSGRFLERSLYPFALIATAVLTLASREFRSSRLVWFAYFWAAGYALVLSASRLQTERYFIPLVVPMCAWTAQVATLAGGGGVRGWAERLARAAACVAAAAAVCFGAVRVASYLAAPRYSFVTMADSVRTLAVRDAGSSAFLIGTLANSVSLRAGIPSIDAIDGTKSLEWRLRRYRPTHYLSLGTRPKELAVIARLADLDTLAKFDVFENYLQGQRVHLHRLRFRDLAGPGAAAGPRD